MCPRPGALPFRTESYDFARAQSETFAANNPRIKDEGGDILGNPGGAYASIYLADDQAPASGSLQYRGTKARTTNSGGLFSKPFVGEPVSLWSYNEATAEWGALGRTTTDDNGMYQVTDSAMIAPNGQPIYSILEGDSTCAESYDYLLPPGSKIVITDIDGTLTTDDNELIMQIPDESYVPKMMTAADLLVQTWSMKGYPIIYLTARPHVFRTESRLWLRDLGFSVGPMITSNGTQEADGYKTVWLEPMVETFGWVPVAAYGNASTDIVAYEAAGIPKEKTFIVGPLAGSGGTVAIANMDFTEHIATYVNAQPNNP